MRYVASLLMMASVALPSVVDAKAVKPTAKASRAARAPRPVTHDSKLVGAVWFAPATGGLVAAAIAGIATANAGVNTSRGPATPPPTSGAPTVSPE